MLDQMAQWNTSKFAIYVPCKFPATIFQQRPANSLGRKIEVAQNEMYDKYII